MATPVPTTATTAKPYTILGDPTSLIEYISFACMYSGSLFEANDEALDCAWKLFVAVFATTTEDDDFVFLTISSGWFLSTSDCDRDEALERNRSRMTLDLFIGISAVSFSVSFFVCARSEWFDDNDNNFNLCSTVNLGKSNFRHLIDNNVTHAW